MYKNMRKFLCFLFLCICVLTGKTELSYADFEQYQEIKVGQSVEITALAQNMNETWFSFRPAKSGNYEFSSSGDCDTVIYIYDVSDEVIASDDDSGVGMNFSLTVNLTEGETYYICLNNFESDTDSRYTFSVNKEKRVCISGEGRNEYLSVGNKLSLGIENEEDIAEYKWESSDKSIATVSKGGIVTAKAEGSCEITLLGMDLDGTAFTSRVYITVMNELTAGQPIKVSIHQGESKKKYLFIPAVTGEYVFSSTGNCDTFVSLYLLTEDGMEYLCSGDDELGLNFSIVASLQAGMKYILETGRYGSSADAEFDIQVCSKDAPYIRNFDQDKYLAKGVSFTLKMENTDKIADISYSSSDEKIASVDETGKVKGLKAGTVTITAKGHDQNGISFRSSRKFIITAPALFSSSKDKILNTYEEEKHDGYYYFYHAIGLSGMNENSTISIKSSSINLKIDDYMYIDQDGKLRISLYAKKNGSYKLTIKADGKTLTAKIRVAKIHFTYNDKQGVIPDNKKKWDPYDSNLILYKDETTTLEVKGLSEDDIVKWSSSNKDVATVSKKGKVTAKSRGKATITAAIGNLKIKYKLEVTYKTSAKAIRYAKKVFGATYSQDRRMEKGYYDCSSYVWRSYHDAGKNLGSDNWAPTAADMAKWCVDKKLMVYAGKVPVSKLKAGDLIFYCDMNSSRYKGIGHVDLYQGGKSVISVNQLGYMSGTLNNVMVARPCGGKVSMKTYK